MDDNTQYIDLSDFFNGEGHDFTNEEIRIIRRVLEILGIDPNETNSISMKGKLVDFGLLILLIKALK